MKNKNFVTHRDWIHLDGSVKQSFHDSVQISIFERLLTLIENESQIICLPNGDSIHSVSSELKYIIETPSIKHISPSLSNRCQLVYIEKDLIDDTLLFQRYLLSEAFPPCFKRHHQHLVILFESIVVPILEKFKDKKSQEVFNFRIKQFKIIVNDFISLFQVLLDEFLKMAICSKKIDMERIQAFDLKSKHTGSQIDTKDDTSDTEENF